MIHINHQKQDSSKKKLVEISNKWIIHNKGAEKKRNDILKAQICSSYKYLVYFTSYIVSEVDFMFHLQTKQYSVVSFCFHIHTNNHINYTLLVKLEKLYYIHVQIWYILLYCVVHVTLWYNKMNDIYVISWNILLSSCVEKLFNKILIYP